MHHRSISISDHHVRITDELRGEGIHTSTTVFKIAPGLTATLASPDRIEISEVGCSITVTGNGPELTLEEGTAGGVAVDFGKVVGSTTIVIKETGSFPRSSTISIALDA